MKHDLYLLSLEINEFTVYDDFFPGRFQMDPAGTDYQALNPHSYFWPWSCLAWTVLLRLVTWKVWLGATTQPGRIPCPFQNLLYPSSFARGLGSITRYIIFWLYKTLHLPRVPFLALERISLVPWIRMALPSVAPKRPLLHFKLSG